MTSDHLILAAAAGAISLAICATLWAFAQRRRLEGVVSRLKQQLDLLEKDNLSAHASAEAFDSALLAVEDGVAHLASGEDSLDACATVLGIAPGDPQGVVNALMRADPDHAKRLRALFERGEPCAFEARGPAGTVSTGWARMPPGSLAATPIRALPQSSASRTPMRTLSRPGPR